MSDLVSLEGKRVWVAGHTGMVGSALARRLQREKCIVLTTPRSFADLRKFAEATMCVQFLRPEYIFLAAAKVGGIQDNAAHPIEYVEENIRIYSNVINAAGQHSVVKKLIFLGAACMYPRECPQPMKEADLWNGKLEPTNAGFALAKLYGMSLCQFYAQQRGKDFITAIPANLFGVNDSLDTRHNHVFPALVMKIHEAMRAKRKTVTLWGTGSAVRDFMDVDVAADGLVFLAKNYTGLTPVNISASVPISIARLASVIAKVMGYNGAFAYDRSKPDGMPFKALDAQVIYKMGWNPPPVSDFESSVTKAVNWIKEQLPP